MATSCDDFLGTRNLKDGGVPFVVTIWKIVTINFGQLTRGTKK